MFFLCPPSFVVGRDFHKHICLFLFTQLSINSGYLFYPFSPLIMLQLEYFGERPVEVIGNVGYLLIELIEGVAYYPPG